MSAHDTVRSTPSSETAVLVGLAAAALVAGGLLRAFHAGTPHLPALGPFGSLLFLLPAGLLLVHVVQRRAGEDLLDPPGEGHAVVLAQVIPLLFVVTAEKWMSTDFLADAFDWVDGRSVDGWQADALFRLWTGLSLAGFSLAVLPVMRQLRPRLAFYASGLRARHAVLNALAGFALMELCLFVLAGTTGATWHWIRGHAVLAGSAQVVRSGAEELFYRGLLQTALVRLLIQAGLPDRRRVRILAIVTVSVAFCLEHLVAVPWDSTRAAVSALAYVFLLSIMLGLLLEVSRNLYLVMIAHALLNLYAIGVLPLPVGAAGIPLVQPNVVGLILLMLMFGGVTIAHRHGNVA